MNKVNADTPAASAVASAVASDDLESGFLPEDLEYRKTGKLSEKDDDEKDEKGEKSAAATEENEEEETEQEKNADTEAASAAANKDEKDENAETAAASAAASTQEKDGKGPATTKGPHTRESRERKLSKENRELREKLARYEGREEGRQSVQPTRDTQQTSQSATDGKTPKPKLEDVDEKTGKPKYATYADYENARDEWNRKEAIREFQEQTSTSERQRSLQAAEAEIGKALAKKFETARTKYKDFDEVALNNDLVIPKGSVTDAFLIDSDHAADVLYHLGQHPEILEGFYGEHDPKSGKYVNKMTPQQQFRKLMAIEAEVSKPAPAKKITQAGRPPNQVDGKNAVTKSARDQAIEDGDSSTYINDANATDPRLAAVRASRKKG